MRRRPFLVLVASAFAVALAAPVTSVEAADYPRRPINIIVPFKAGGGTDAYARALSAAAEGALNVPLVVVNRPGSGGLNGAQAAMRARPDGYTVMLTSGGSFLLSTMMRDTPVDPFASFKIVAQVGELRTSLMVPAASGFKSVQDVIAAAKEKPGQLRWAHSGRGGFHHVAGLGFLAKNGLEAQDVPFKGGGPARAALIGAQTDFGFIGVQQARGFEEQIRPLAVNAQERDGVMTEVPSFGEFGIPFAAISSPVIVFAPKDTPDDVVAVLTTALQDIVAKPKFAELLAARGTGPSFADPGTAGAKLRAMKTDAEPLVASLKN